MSLASESILEFALVSNRLSALFGYSLESFNAQFTLVVRLVPDLWS